jgi:leader peptidase (prepilin peptidase)/N-methyltransferase
MYDDAILVAVGVLGVVAATLINALLYSIRMRGSGDPPSWWIYAGVIAVTPALFLGLLVRFGVTAQLPAYLYLTSVGVLLAVLEFDVRLLPDSVLLPSYVIGVLLLMPAGAATGDWSRAERGVLAWAALSAMFWVLAVAYPHSVGFGDVKLAGLLGLHLGWLSWSTVLIGAMGSFFMVGFGGVALAGNRRVEQRAVPLGPCLILASMLALFVTVPISTWYGSILNLA